VLCPVIEVAAVVAAADPTAEAATSAAGMSAFAPLPQPVSQQAANTANPSNAKRAACMIEASLQSNSHPEGGIIRSLPISCNVNSAACWQHETAGNDADWVRETR
jgi:hypothetical protein